MYKSFTLILLGLFICLQSNAQEIRRCEEPLNVAELRSNLVRQYQEVQNGIVIIEHFGPDVGYFYEVRNLCPNIGVGGSPLPPGFDIFNGAYFSCDGTIICNYGFDRPIACISDSNPLDLTLATTRKVVYEVLCSYEGVQVEACQGESISIDRPKSVPTAPTVPGAPSFPACDYSSSFLNSEDDLELLETEDGFSVSSSASSNFSYRIFDLDGICGPVEYVYTINVDPSCGDNSLTQPDIFRRYDWMNALIDYTDSEDSSVDVYSKNGNLFVFVRIGESYTLYDVQGNVLCTDSPNQSCLSNFDLTTVIATWTSDNIDSNSVFATICPGDHLPNLQAPFAIGDATFSACGPAGPVGSPPVVCPCSVIFNVDITPKTGVISNLLDRQFYTVAPETTTTYTITSTSGGAPDLPCIPETFSSTFTIVVKTGEVCEASLGCACDDVFLPVCGVDGQSYSNRCFAECEGVDIISEGECNSSNELPDFFNDYPFLSTLINPDNCAGFAVDVYDVNANTFIHVSNNGQGQLYLNGNFYCNDSENLSCVQFYQLSSPIHSWTCGDDNDCICTAEFIPVCGADGNTYGNPCEAECAGVEIIGEGECENTIACNEATGTIFFDTCDDGTRFIFIGNDDGSIVDPYTESGAPFDGVQGQRIRYNYSEAGFESPCTIASKAIYIDCLEEIGQDVEADCNNHFGSIFFETCRDGVTYFLIESEGEIYDPYYINGIDFDHYDGQPVRFDFFDADFVSPCEIAAKAIFITCIEEDFPDDSLSDAIELLQELIDPSACDDIRIRIYETDQENLIYVQTNGFGTLYDEAGIVQCSDGGAISCLSSFGLEIPLGELSCSDLGFEDQPVDDFDGFNAYPWLNNIIAIQECGSSQIEVFDNGAFAFIYILDGNTGILYFEDGSLYCTDRPDFDCKNAYNLTAPSSTWSCPGDEHNSGDDQNETDNQGGNEGSSSTLNQEIRICPGTSTTLNIPIVGSFGDGSDIDPGCPPPPASGEGLPCPCSLITQVDISPEIGIIDQGEGFIIVNPEGQTSYTVTVSTGKTDPDSSCIPVSFETVYTIIPDLEECDGLQETDISEIRTSPSIDETELSIFPNPAIDKIQVSGLPDMEANIHINNIIGKRLMSINHLTSATKTIDVSTFETGIYILVWENSIRTISRKFVVQ